VLEIVRNSGAEVIGLDWRTDMGAAISRLGPDVVIQGNLDPCALFLPEHDLRIRVSSMLRQGREAKAHIFNLGHGILPEIPSEKARLLVDLVHELSV
jgi:uroporphyrinogen decarboxylase